MLKAKTLKEIKMACIVDPFTREGFLPECQILELTPSDYEKELEEFQPDFLFVESAWQGKDDLWKRKVSNLSSELYHLLLYCREHHVPIVFWNKEDPVYTDTFLPVAKLADVVLTTDADCIGIYKEACGHERVYHMHFAAQPAIYHPFEKEVRSSRCCFAGSYYHK